MKSDVDIYIEPTNFLNLSKYMSLKHELQDNLKSSVDVITPDNTRSGIHKYITQDMKQVL